MEKYYIEGIMIDITRKEADEAIKGRNMQKQLIEQNQSFSQYDHENQTPLNEIQFYRFY
jgi:hypothetical protein